MAPAFLLLPLCVLLAAAPGGAQNIVEIQTKTADFNGAVVPTVTIVNEDFDRYSNLF